MIYCNDELELMQDEKKYGETYEQFDTILRCNGYDPASEKTISFKDAMELPSASFMIPRVLTNFVQEGAEPLLIGKQLLQRLEYTPGMTTIFPSIDTLVAEEVGDGMSLPIKSINMGGNQMFGITVKRHGLALRVSRKFIDQSTYPWIQWWMRLAGNALARHSEEYIWSFVNQLGISIFDNDVNARKTGAAGQPEKGATTGRNIKGEFNGSITMDDIYDMYATILLQGYIPDTILCHPMTFLSFVRDPVMREFALISGGGSFFQNFTGKANAQAFANQYNFGGLGMGKGQNKTFANGKMTGGQQSTVQGLPQDMTAKFEIPSYLGMKFRILVSPFCKYNPLDRTSDILMFDSSNLGALVVAEDPHVNSWTEQGYGIENIGIEESYGITILNEAQGIGVARNVATKPSELYPIARTVYNLSEQNAAFQTKADITDFGAAPTDVLAK